MKLHYSLIVSSIVSQLILGGAAAVDNTIFKKHHHSGESLGECYHILLEGYKECDIQCGIEMQCSDSAEFEADMAQCESCTRGAEMQYEECVNVCFENHPETYAPSDTAPDKNAPRVPFLSKILSGETTLASAEKRLQSVKGVESSVKSVARDLVVAIDGTDDDTPPNFAECYREVVSGYDDCKDVCGECPECDLENDDFWTCAFGCTGCTVQAEVRMFGCVLNCIDLDDDDDTNGKSGVDDDDTEVDEDDDTEVDEDDDTNGKSGVDDDDDDDDDDTNGKSGVKYDDDDDY